MPRGSYEERLDDIRRTEYGLRSEIYVRYGAVVLGTLAAWLLYDQRLALVWAALHLGLQILLALLLRRRLSLSARETYRAALTVYVLAGVIFALYPILLITAPDSPLALRIAGGAGLMGLSMYMLQRRQREAGMVISDALQASAIVAAFILMILPDMPDVRAAILVTLVVLVLYVYFIAALLSGMKQQALLRDTQSRYASSQKARALNQFVGGVAHDFNNQLTAILGHLELFEVLDDPDERRTAISESRRAARRAALTVQQLLASSGRTRLAPRAVPLAALLADLKCVLEDLLEPGMRVTVVPPGEAEIAWVDADMLETCLIQLCLNAQDATLAQGKIRLWVETRTTLPEQESPIGAPPPYSVLVCEDDGPGVPAEALHMLAEPFYTTKSASEGAGLGLSAVAGFARQSGGALIISRAPLAGLRISLALPTSAPPRRMPANADAAQQTTEAPATAPLEERGAPRTSEIV
ncbi:ATP-binding protein [Sagittula salina]|uniref:histidine kinase n=1 Tax=Sagittula salina TaxID=2820268 RepID=A0A940MLI2_9RHOB|nr:ATP-binding protein [Sagittula salina]MBP0480907.1 hypothetical protein [Sagittula salina]